MASTYQGFKSSSINASNCHAERELTLSQVDSMYQNGEINQVEAKRMAITVLIDLDATGEVFATILK